MTISTQNTSTTPHVSKTGVALSADGSFEVKLLEPTLGGDVAKLDLNTTLYAHSIFFFSSLTLSHLFYTHSLTLTNFFNSGQQASHKDWGLRAHNLLE